MKKENMIFRLKLEITELVTEMVGKLPESLFISDSTTFLDPSMGGGQFVQAIESRLRKHGHSDDNIKNRVFGVEKSILRVNYAVNSRKLVGSYIVDNKDVPDIFMNMKFDAIVGNPPYQKAVGEMKTEPLWHIFVENSIKSLKDGGYLCLVHPSGWRNVDGRFKEVRGLITSKDVQYLEIHNERDGIKTFNAETRYDWYVLQNVASKGKTLVKFQDGLEETIDLNKVKFIPNSAFGSIISLLAKDGEERVEILYSSSEYETRLETSSKTKTSKFKYPIVYTVANKDKLNLWWSSEKKGHFGIPKVIWSNGRIVSIGTIVDIDGKYGLTQFAYGIIDDPDNLNNIKKALDNPKFREIMEQCSVGELGINRKALALFRKDFWKEFI